MIEDPWPAPRAREPVDLVLRLPGSKSLTNRALVLAAVADGPSTVRAALRSRDTLLMAAALRGLGAGIDVDGDDWAVTPRTFAGDAAIDCGLAGTVMRFVPPVAGLSYGTVSFDGDPHMRSRPVGEVLGALRTLGIDVVSGSGAPGGSGAPSAPRASGAGASGGLPFSIRGTGSVRGGVVTIDASASSQFVSALLLAGARYDEGVDVRHVGKPVPSLPHIDMTVAMLRERGVGVEDPVSSSEVNRWRVAPGPVAALDSVIEPDLSNAAPFLALAAISGGTVVVRDWPRATTQAGDLLRDILEQMGCGVDLDDAGLRVTGPDDGAAGLSGVDLDLHDAGELAPAVAALCALSGSPSHLRGIAHIRHHETDRLAALSTELAALGAQVVEREDGLSISPAPLTGGVFHTYADHRMAHAGVILGAGVDGVRVEDVGTTAKTFTDFAPYWAGLLGARPDAGRGA